jgi:peptidoglycan/LPS O-acetylase OafA/YrhL
MNVVVVALLSVSIPLAALVLHLVQDSVERWEQRRHADD